MVVLLVQGRLEGQKGAKGEVGRGSKVRGPLEYIYITLGQRSAGCSGGSGVKGADGDGACHV